jgi:hypothetical protein
MSVADSKILPQQHEEPLNLSRGLMLQPDDLSAFLLPRLRKPACVCMCHPQNVCVCPTKILLCLHMCSEKAGVCWAIVCTVRMLKCRRTCGCWLPRLSSASLVGPSESVGTPLASQSVWCCQQSVTWLGATAGEDCPHSGLLSDSVKLSELLLEKMKRSVQSCSKAWKHILAD